MATWHILTTDGEATRVDAVGYILEQGVVTFYRDEDEIVFACPVNALCYAKKLATTGDRLEAALKDDPKALPWLRNLIATEVTNGLQTATATRIGNARIGR